MTRARARAYAQAFIGRKLDRSNSISYQTIILEILFHGRKEGRNAGRTGYTLAIEGSACGLP